MSFPTSSFDVNSRVTFVLRCETEFGQRVRVIGNDSRLGGWDPRRGVELTTSAGAWPSWRVSVDLPAGRKVEYKYVVQQGTPNVLPGDEDLVVGSPDGPGMTPGSVAADAAGSVGADTMDGSMKWELFEENRTLTTRSGHMIVNDGEFGKWNDVDEGRVKCFLTPDEGFGDAIESLVIVLYRLPIIAKRDSTTGAWSFKWDDDALYLTSTGLRKGLEQLKVAPLWVGILNSEDEVPRQEREGVADRLLEEFNCVPVFIPHDTLKHFYQGFCKGTLWPLFHMVSSATDHTEHTTRFDDHLWRVYMNVNRMFRDKVVEVYDGDRTLIWVHDYHLMLLPQALRSRLSGVKIGFFLHIPWPSSEVYRVLPWRNELLKGMLSATLLGFHLFDYARHFLSACVRLLNLEHEANRGSLGLDYDGRHVMLRVSHIGVDPERFSEGLSAPTLTDRVAEFKERFADCTVLGAVDDLDLIKGIALKLMGFQRYLDTAPKMRGKVVLVQVAIPKAARVKAAVRNEIRELVAAINDKHGDGSGRRPVWYLEESISFESRLALYSIMDALVVTPIRDGLNLIPYEYIVSTSEGKGQLVLSEFTGCSRALSSAVRVNPWDLEKLCGVLDMVVQKAIAASPEVELKRRADKAYVSAHSSQQWAQSFLHDLKEASEPAQVVVKVGPLAGLPGVLTYDEFTLLNRSAVLRAYKAAKRRLFLFDYDGTLTSITEQSSQMAHAWARPSEAVAANLDTLSKDPINDVYIMSGRKTEVLEAGLNNSPTIGIAAEHGFFYRKKNSKEWQRLLEDADLSWMELTLRIMLMYTDRTDGSYVEQKTAGIVWHYLDADREFGSWQAKEMRDHLESLLTPFSVQVVSGYGWLQVRMAAMNKGVMVETILQDMPEPPDFVLCCGDDRTDEDMFTYLDTHLDPSVKQFTCTVGVKPSNARYYLHSSNEVGALLETLVTGSYPRGVRPRGRGASISLADLVPDDEGSSSTPPMPQRTNGPRTSASGQKRRGLASSLPSH